ncbi:MAG: phosphoesterase, partial [Acidobacteria bacterium]|nr:phosphoesterase [Acidobacteriota bacterium]
GAPDLEELVSWADIVDGAMFPDAWTAVSMEAPALKLALVMEAGPDGDMARWLIPQMARRPLREIAGEEKITRQFQPLYEQHLRSLDSIRELGRCEQGVLFFDLTGPGIEVYNKFAPYFLFPDCVYSVSICPSSFRTKISVGSNPWNQSPAPHNLATICERYGGGGHARVGAISLEPGSLEKARQIAQEIVGELQKPVRLDTPSPGT